MSEDCSCEPHRERHHLGISVLPLPVACSPSSKGHQQLRPTPLHQTQSHASTLRGTTFQGP